LSGSVAVDLRDVSSARLAFSSWKPDEFGSAEVQVSLDGVSWTTIAEVGADGAGWDSVEIALDDYVGQVAFVRLTHTSVASAGPSTWWVTNLRLVKHQTPR
jgi:hypothetical protein